MNWIEWNLPWTEGRGKIICPDFLPSMSMTMNSSSCPTGIHEFNCRQHWIGFLLYDTSFDFNDPFEVFPIDYSTKHFEMFSSDISTSQNLNFRDFRLTK